jgi:hypothetical protein
MKIKNKNLIKSVSFRSNVEKILLNSLLSLRRIYETCQTNIKTRKTRKIRKIRKIRKTRKTMKIEISFNEYFLC